MKPQFAFPLDLPTERDLLAKMPRLELAYQLAEEEAERAAEAVNDAAGAYRADRNHATLEAYKRADRRYDAARFEFQRASYDLVTARRNVAHAKRERELQAATVRMI